MLEVGAAVRAGLTAARKSLPAWLLYDEAGCALYEQITRLPEYYLTRAEAEIFARQGEAILDAVSPDGARLVVAELGAGTAEKSELLLQAVLRRQQSCTFVANDVAEGALREARARLARSLPSVEMELVVGGHAALLPALSRQPERPLVLFIGSSIGNLPDDAAAALLGALRGGLRQDGLLLLGTDRKKDPALLHAAYDDAAGVTARFSLNLLTRLNRELDADFALEDFRHVAEWHEEPGNVEIFLASTRAQRVRLRALGLEVAFEAGERIHTETSAKYDLPRVERLFAAAGLVRRQSFEDEAGSFAVHLAGVALVQPEIAR